MYYQGKSDYKTKYSTYSNFTCLKEYNQHMEMFLASHKGAFTKSEFIVFRRLTKFCAVVFGVATISIAKLLKAVKEMDHAAGISESTFHRMKRKAKKLGILTWKETRKPFQRQSSNIWIFNKMPNSEIKSDTPPAAPKAGQSLSAKEKEHGTALAPLKASNQSKTNKSNKRKARVQSEQVEGKEKKIKSNVPEAFRSILTPFLSKPTEIDEFWRMAQHYSRKCPFELEKDLLVRMAIGAFQLMMPKLKQDNVENPIAYFNGVLQKRLAALAAKDIQEERALVIDEGYQNVGDVLAELERKERENGFMLRVERKSRKEKHSLKLLLQT